MAYRKMKMLPVYTCLDGEANNQGVVNGKHGVSVGKPCCRKAKLSPTPQLFSHGSDMLR